MAKSKGRLLSELAEAPKNEDYSDVNALPNTGNKVGDQAFVEATDRLYIWNGSGWYNIALINTTPTWNSGGQPASSYELSADSPQTATSITLAASDPEGIPISYNYVTGGSMDSIATISQDSSVFTITPKTEAQTPDGGTGSITFRATDGVNILPQVSSFTLNFVTIVTDSKYTTLLATAVDTSDNNNITDTSTNNHSITVNGDAHAGTFSPYRSGGYSWDFEGAGFYTNDTGHGESIEAENNASAFNVGTNDYTIEGWFKERDSETYSTNSYARLFDLGPNDDISLMRNYPSTGGKKLLLKENATVIITSTNDVFDGNWHFIQVIRTGGYTKLYVDGTEEGSIASTTNINAISKIIVGAWSDYSYGFDGQIADFRFSNTARTAAVPTERLTSDSNTKLLVCSKPYLVDESGTATSLVLLKSANGTRDYPDAIAFSPYDYNEYDAANHGGSMYFDGTGDYVEMPGHSSLVLDTSNFTLEFWYKHVANVTTMRFLGNNYQNSTWGGGRWTMGIISGKLIFQANSLHGGGNYTSSTVSIDDGAWHHCSLTRDGSTFTLRVDGNDPVTYANSGSLDGGNSYGFTVGGRGNGTEMINGYISDFKLVKGTVLYTADFTPPTAPLSSSGTSLHIKGTDASIIDKSQGANLKLVGDTTGSTTQVKFNNTKSMYLDGSGDYIQASLTEDNLPNEFTIEGWVYTSTVSGPKGIFGIDTTAFPSTAAGIAVFTRGSTYNYDYAFYCNGNQVNSTTPPTANSWQHFALVRDSNNLVSLYLDGSSIASSTISGTVNGSIITIGGYYSSSYLWNGYIQDFRITKGLARYTAADETSNIPSAPLEG